MMKYVIVGNGVAGITASMSIRKIDSEGSIKIITDEAYPYYSRIRLIEFLSGDADEKGLTIKQNEWYDQNQIELVLNNAVTDIDEKNKEVITSSAEKIEYDKLLLATGGVPFVPPIPGAEIDGVYTLRTMKDAIEIRKQVTDGDRQVVIIGGGVLGLEVGNSIRKAGNSISVVEFFPRLLPRQMDPDGADILKSQMESMGFKFFLGSESKEIIGKDHAEALILKDGTRIDCDMIIISAGIRPKAELAKKLGLKMEKGVIVNDRMETPLPDIYAAGDLIQHRERTYGIWPASEKQGEIAGINMAGGSAVYEGTTMSNKLKVVGIDLLAAGDIDADGKLECFVVSDPENFIYKKMVIKDNIVVGTILLGDITNWQRILKAIEAKKDIGTIEDELDRWKLELR
jgi:nitrite reductase (NADH) large subunit